MDSEAFENKVKLFTIALEKMPAELSNLRLVSHIDDPYLRSTISACLNHQRAGQDLKSFPDFLKDVTLPTMVHSLMSLPLDMFSLQAYDSTPCDGIYYFQEAGNPKTIKKGLTTTVVRPSLQMNDLSMISDDEVINHLLEVSCATTQDMVNHAIKKIIDESPKRELTLLNEKTSNEAIVGGLMQASEEIHESIGRTANFVIMNTEMAKSMQGLIKTYYDFDSLPINIRGVGVMKNRWKVFISSDFPDMIIMGYRGHHPVDAGIVLSPCDLFAKPKKGAVSTESGGYSNIPPTAIYKFNWEGSLTLPRPDYFRVIKLKLSKKHFDIHEL